jgi:DNA replication and repair protein RecF
VISYNKDYFNIYSGFYSGESGKKNIRIYHSNSEGKHLFINKKEISKFSEYVGTVPCVTLTLDNLKLILGGPQERRRFLDILISQVSPLYLENLKIYRRTVMQKNALLSSGLKSEVKNQIYIWNEKMIEHGSRIISQRLKFIRFLNRHLSEFYNRISSLDDKIDTEYKSSLGDLSNRNIAEVFLKKLEQFFEYEFERKRSAIGPHRDDVQFFREGKAFRDFCSQGENKTLVIALKFLEWEYISNERKIKPILLLDDIFGELDEIRMSGLLDFLEVIGQAYITTTMQDKFDSHRGSRKYILKEKKLYDA